MKTCLKFLLLLFLVPGKTVAQCPFDPTVSGDTLLCPNTTGQLTTQVYDAYQWYKRPFSGSTAQPVAGATAQTLTVDALNDAGFYFKVAATLNGCTEFSPEVLVDGWVFLGPYTIIEGDYTIGGNGEIVLCQDDTLFLISGMPYNTNLQWFNGGVLIAGATNDTLFVTSPGSYTFSGAPQVCPNYLQTQFIPVDVTVITCPTGLPDAPGYEVSIIPNPAFDMISITYPGCEKLEIFDASGKLVISRETDPNAKTHQVDVSLLPPGYYTVIAGSLSVRKAAILSKP